MIEIDRMSMSMGELKSNKIKKNRTLPFSVEMLKLVDHFFKKVRVLLNPIWPLYTKFEGQLFLEIKKLLSPEQKKIFENQVQEINYVQRAPRYEYINYYKLTAFKVSLERFLKFTPNTGEWILKECRVYVDGKPVLNAKFWVVNGIFCSIEFDDCAKEFKNNINVKLVVKE